MKMKKIALGLLFGTLVLTGCSNGEANESTTESSLKAEVSKLQAQNKELKERITTFESIFEEDDQTTTEETSEQPVSETFKINTAATFESGEKITVTEIKANDAIKLNNKAEGEHPVAVMAVIENTTNAPIDVNVQQFDLYDADDEMCRFDSSTYSNNIPHELAVGKKANVVLHFGAKKGAPYSVTYGPATWTE